MLMTVTFEGTINGVPVASHIVSTVMPGAVSRSTRPFSVGSMTAISVTIRVTGRRDVAGNVSSSTIFGLPFCGYCQLGAEEAKLPRAQPSRQHTSAHEGSTSRIAPRGKGAVPGSAILTGGNAMAAELEVVVDRSVRGEEPLRTPG
jgi:hypothetical protein